MEASTRASGADDQHGGDARGAMAREGAVPRRGAAEALVPGVPVPRIHPRGGRDRGRCAIPGG